MNRTEPTTGDWKREVKNPTHADFARAYRELAERKMNANGLVCVDTAMIHQAADRLESQERKIADIENFHKEMLKDHKAHVAALTARAEQAEKERDAAVEHVHDAIFGTNHSCFYCTMENCDGCTNSTVKEHFKYRGLLPRKYLVKNEGETE